MLRPPPLTPQPNIPPPDHRASNRRGEKKYAPSPHLRSRRHHPRLPPRGSRRRPPSHGRRDRRPAADRFQVITEHSAEGLIYDPNYLNVDRTDKVVFIQITLSFGRKPQQKRALYKRIVELLTKSPGIRPQNVVINLVETAWENWSFGNGDAHYMDA
jgi:4-oxalocrotonate tautomerase